LTDGLIGANPLLAALAADPSLRGALGALSFGLMGVQHGQLELGDLAQPMTMAADTAKESLAGRLVVTSPQRLLQPLRSCHRAAVIPVARKLWLPSLVAMPAAAARRPIIA
jgi:hypothetical protein